MAGTMTRETFNASTYLVDRNLAAGRGSRVAVVGSSRSLTYYELAELRDRIGVGLRSFGLRCDDRVMMVMNDDIEMFATILACFHAGLVAVPVSTMLTGPELGELLRDSGARALMVTGEFAGAVTEAVAAASDLDFLITVGGAEVTAPAPVRVMSWEALFAEGSNEAVLGAVDTSPDSWALWLYTSGTTGSPKAAMHRHANIRHVCETYGQRVLGITEDDICLSVAKLFFAYGIGNSMFFPLSVGARTLLEPRRPTPAVVAERIVHDRATLFFGVPTFFAGLVASDLADGNFASVRLSTSAGESLPAELQRRFTGRFGVKILDGIGSTEALHIFLSNTPDDIHPGSTGKAVPGYDLELRDEEGHPVGTGTPGVLYVRGESLALGYWHRDNDTRAVFEGGWMRTGDSYLQDEEGYFICLGRANDLLKAGGIWVSPSEVEARLLEHPGVAEAVVVGLADEDGLEKPVACVVMTASHQDVTEPALISWCREGLAAFKRPRAVMFIDEIPKTATGKVQRFRIREQVGTSIHLGSAGQPPVDAPSESPSEVSS